MKGWYKGDDYFITDTDYTVCKVFFGGCGQWAYEAWRLPPKTSDGKRIRGQYSTKLGHFVYGDDVESDARTLAFKQAMTLIDVEKCRITAETRKIETYQNEETGQRPTTI